MVFITKFDDHFLNLRHTKFIMMSSGKSPAAIPFSLHSLAFPVVAFGISWLDMMNVIAVVILRIGDFKCKCKTRMRELRHHCRYLLLVAAK
jgi:hypothetical protein